MPRGAVFCVFQAWLKVKAANLIKQEAGFPACFPDENLMLAVFNYEELYNSKSKHYSN